MSKKAIGQISEKYCAACKVKDKEILELRARVKALDKATQRLKDIINDLEEQCEGGVRGRNQIFDG